MKNSKPNPLTAHNCLLRDFGQEEMRCLKCNYITYKNKSKTTNQIISKMVKDGYPLPNCSKQSK